MTIEQAIERMAEMKAEIKKAVETFTEDTGMKVQSVAIPRYSVLSCNGKVCSVEYKVETQVGL